MNFQTEGERLPQRPYLWLSIIVLTLTLIRLPFVWYGPGVQDENWFSAPGWTVAHEGIPRVPYLPVRDRASVFYRADDLLFTLPPALYYVQAPFFLLLPATYATARMPSLFAGTASLCVLFLVLRRMTVREEIALAAVAICGFSRPFFFAWTNTRPDMLCALCGLTAMLWGLKFLDSPSRRNAIVAGLFVGFGLLAHPFAIVFVLQLTGVMLFALNRSWLQRVGYLTLAGLSAAVSFGLWIPLILLDTDAFWVQFSNNVLSRSGPGIISRLIWPWSALGYQCNLFWERNGVFQTTICAIAIASGIALCLYRRKKSVVVGVGLALSALYFHLASVGSHPSIDYWCYSWTWISILIALSLETIADQIHALRGLRLLPIVVASLIFICLIPGSGLRTCWVYLSRSNEVEYDRTRFCKLVAERLPANAKLLVTADYVFEFEALGKHPIDPSCMGMFEEIPKLDFDFWIASRSNTADGWPQSIGCQKLWSIGHAEDSLSCYVDVYSAPSDIQRVKFWPR